MSLNRSRTTARFVAALLLAVVSFSPRPVTASAQRTRMDTILYGVSYYHEYMPYERLDKDVELMKAAGLNVVRMGESSWGLWEPREGHFEFAWMDTIFDKAEKNGVSVILATPGGARPAWMAFKYLEVLRVDEFGRRQKWGGRHNHCMTSLRPRTSAGKNLPVFSARY